MLPKSIKDILNVTVYSILSCRFLRKYRLNTSPTQAKLRKIVILVNVWLKWKHLTSFKCVMGLLVMPRCYFLWL